MFFNSLHFLVFFASVVVLYFAIPSRYRWVLLLAASYYFYGCWRVEYLGLIILSTLVDYFSALEIQKSTTVRRRKTFLIISLSVNLGLLAVFKYFNFFNESFRGLFDAMGVAYSVSTLDLLLPVGISFYTFQTLSYTIDVYRGKKKAEKHLGIFAVYVSFFPQLVAGPIERSDRLMPQFFEYHSFNYERVVSGLRLMLWGFFKKLVIADRVAVVVNNVYENPDSYGAAAVVIATIFFAFQIFCDFSAYSDIAIGSARVMGYELMTNFRQPYFARSVSEFWSRWHISLSTWFRDYLYIPLGGNRVKKYRWYLNLFIVFLISGLWHGANWTFVVWGALHGAYLVFALLTANVRNHIWTNYFKFLPKLTRPILQVGITYFLVLIAWVFFRAESVQSAFHILTLFPQGISELIPNSQNLAILRNTFAGLGLRSFDMTVAIASIGLMELIHLFSEKEDFWDNLSKRPLFVRWGLYYVLLASIFFLGSYNTPQQFIYFQF